MNLKQLTELYQILSNIKTEGQSTILMANCLVLINNIITEINKPVKLEPEIGGDEVV